MLLLPQGPYTLPLPYVNHHWHQMRRQTVFSYAAGSRAHILERNLEPIPEHDIKTGCWSRRIAIDMQEAIRHPHPRIGALDVQSHSRAAFVCWLVPKKF